jgi:phytoene dehydrogenase-like protein
MALLSRAMMNEQFDVVVVGAGPNGLAAAITCARAGLSVALIEGKDSVGGGARSAALTLPGFVHDVCSAIHPLAVVSPLYQKLPLEKFGLAWAHPEIPVAHPLDHGRAALLERTLEATAASLEEDGAAYSKLLRPLVARAQDLYDDALAPLRFPGHPLLLARFGMRAMQSTVGLANRSFRGPLAKALFAGNGAHSFLPLERNFSAAFSLMLGVAGHSVGWPCARGGSQKVSDALADYFRSLGGTVILGMPINSMPELPPAKAYLFDVFPHALARIAGDQLPISYRNRLARYRHAPGVFKVDWALDAAIPWTNANVRRAGTVHVGGTLEEVAAGESAVGRGEHTEKPFVLVAQQSVMDPSRAPIGKHTAWAYCHVPFGSTVDHTAIIERQIERFAPGFRDCILATHTMSPAQYGAYNPNNEGGDITGGANDFAQLFTRPVARANPYTTPAKNIFLCSSSTPPGGGVHGMCGYFAAKAALDRVFGKRTFLEEESK